MRSIDLCGKRFGKWIVIKEDLILNKPHNIKWVCICDCGIQKSVFRTSLTRGRSKSCGCSHYYSKNNHPQWKGYGDISGYYYAVIIKSARERNIPFCLTIEEMWEKFITQNKKCALTGLPLIFSTKRDACDGNASLDRINSSLGYVIDNIQWLHKDINIMKNSHDVKYFIDLCKKVSDYNK
jgi:hypothetical protein